MSPAQHANKKPAEGSGGQNYENNKRVHDTATQQASAQHVDRAIEADEQAVRS